MCIPFDKPPLGTYERLSIEEVVSGEGEINVEHIYIVTSKALQRTQFEVLKKFLPIGPQLTTLECPFLGDSNLYRLQGSKQKNTKTKYFS